MMGSPWTSASQLPKKPTTLKTSRRSWRWMRGSVQTEASAWTWTRCLMMKSPCSPERCSRCEAQETWGTTWRGGGRRGWRGWRSQYQETVCHSVPAAPSVSRMSSTATRTKWRMKDSPTGQRSKTGGEKPTWVQGEEAPTGRTPTPNAGTTIASALGSDQWSDRTTTATPQVLTGDRTLGKYYVWMLLIHWRIVTLLLKTSRLKGSILSPSRAALCPCWFPSTAQCRRRMRLWRSLCSVFYAIYVTECETSIHISSFHLSFSVSFCYYSLYFLIHSSRCVVLN